MSDRRVDWLSVGVVGLMIAALEVPWWPQWVGVTVAFIIPVIFCVYVIHYAKGLRKADG